MAKKKENTEVMVISAELQKNLDILQAFKSQVDIIGKNCQQIIVMDEVSLAVGQQNLSKANNLLTSIEEKRVAIKDPYLKSGQLIDSTAKSLSEELSKGITHIKDQVEEWEKKRLAEAAEKQKEIDRQLAEKAEADRKEQERKDNIRAYIRDKATPLLQKMYSECTTVAICDEKLQTITKNFKPKEWFQEFGEEAYQLKDNYVNLIKAKKEQLVSAATMSEHEIELALKQEKLAIDKANIEMMQRELDAEKERVEIENKRKEAEKQAEEEKKRLASEAELNKTRNIRYTWRFELHDIKSVPLDWLTLDEDKVNEWKKANKDIIKDGEITNGVRFFKKMGVAS